MTREIKQPPTNIAGYDPTRAGGSFDWDGQAAARAVDFFAEVLTHPDTSPTTKAGDPFILRPWQRDYVATLYGWKREDKTRRFTETLGAVPRKNGKTALAAGLALFGLVADGQQSAQVYSAAMDRDQASAIYRTANRMVLQSPRLLKRLNCIDSRKRITYRQAGSFYEALSGDANTGHSRKPLYVLFDELHTQRTRGLYDNLRTAQGSTVNRLFASITTAGYDRHSICWEVWQHARKVREGLINDPYFLPCIYELSEGADWQDEAVWHACNPNLGVSISLDFLREECQRAKDSPAYENTFRNLYLNQWCVTADTRFWMEDGSRRTAAELQPGDVVISFDEDTHGLVKGTVSAVATMAASPIYRIRTARGRIIRTNGEHPFWVRSGPSVRKRYGWKKARDLQPGDRVLSALGRPCLTQGSYRIHGDGCYFLGMMIGDGTCRGTPRLTTGDPELVGAFTQFAESLGDAVKARPDGWHYDAVHKVKGSLTRTATRRWLQARGIWGSTCYTKRVPDCVWKAGPAGWAEFISGFLDTDGHVSKTGIIFVSCNRELLQDLQDLLAYLGIQSDLRDPGRPKGFRLEIRDAESFRICQDVLDPRVARKAVALAALLPTAGEDNADPRAFDRVAEVVVEPDEATIGVTVDGWHTHVTNGLVTHNTEQACRWLSMDKWKACGTFDPADLVGAPCWGGLDLSTTTDLSALVLAFRLNDGSIALLCRFWAPEEKARQRGQRDRVPYMEWAKQGLLELTPGDVIDYDYIRREINELHATYNIQELAIDRWNATQIATQLQGDGVPVFMFGQGYASMSGPAKEFEKLVIAGNIRHGGNEILTWNAANVAIEQDAAGNIKPSKSKSTERIDGIVAAVMAVGRAASGGEPTHWQPEDGVCL